MNTKSVMYVLIGLFACGIAPVSEVLAAGFGEDTATCLVKQNEINDPPGAKLRGTIAVDSILVNGATVPNPSDVVLRLERGGEVRFFRETYTAIFGGTDLNFFQNRICQILNDNAFLVGEIKAAFGLPASVTKFVINKRSLRDGEIDSPGEQLIVPPAGAPLHVMTMIDVVIFAQ